jgi:hypothetical protein
MPLLKLLLVFAMTLTFSVVAFGQDQKDGLTFTCSKREEGQMQACGASPFDLTRRFMIGHSPTIHMGVIKIRNHGNRYTYLDLVEISPAYRKDDPLQPFWFTGVVKGTSAKRGGTMTLQPIFVGRQRSTGSHSPTPWVAEGTYEGVMKMKNRANGAIYEFKFTVHAFNPSSKK